MRTITIGLLLFLGMSFSAFKPAENVKSVEAFYDGYSNGLYTFLSDDETEYVFHNCDAAVLKNFDLKNDEELVSRYFEVSYTEVNGKKTITSLKELEIDYYEESDE